MAHVRTDWMFAWLVLLAACSRRTPAIQPDEPRPDSGVAVWEAGADAYGPTFPGRRRLTLEPGTSCVATDALYVRLGKQVGRFTGGSPGSVAALDASFATATSWTARGGTYAWIHSNDGTATDTLLVSRPGVAPRSLATGDGVHTMICDDWVVHTAASHYPSPPGTPAARTDDFSLDPLGAGVRRSFPSGPYTSVHGLACGRAGGVLAVFNDIVNPVLYEIELATGAKRQLAKRAGEWWVAAVASDGGAAFVSTKSSGEFEGRVDAVERIELGGPPKAHPLYRPSANERVWSVFASGGAVLVPIETRRADTQSKEHSLLVLDATTGTETTRIRTNGAVVAAFRGEGLVWCTEIGTYSLP